MLKSLLSLFVVMLVCLAFYTMFEVFGRSEKKEQAEKLKKAHRLNGYIFILFFIVISYFCLDFIARTKTELSARASFHAVFSLSVAALLSLKVLFLRRYRQYYSQVKIFGLLIGLVSFGMIGTSSGYYLLATKFGTERAVDKIIEQEKEASGDTFRAYVRADSESILKGKELYEDKCSFCHDPYSYNKIVGPGHKDILKHETLPVSNRPATPENIASQIRTPFRDMPSFGYLNNEDVLNIIAFLNTL